MMSISQVDMVVLTGNQELQVCGDLSPMVGERNADPQSFTIVVRQGDNIATLHAAGQFDPEAFEFHKNGRWELKGKLRSGDRFEMHRSAVVSAVIILKREPAGLETLSWVQPVTIMSKAQRQQAPEQQLEFHPETLAQPQETALNTGDSVSSSLAILQPDPAHPDTFSGLPRIDKVPQAHPARP
jgi:hypothetical protein